MEKKTKEQLAEEYYSYNYDDTTQITDYKRDGFIAGWDARQPEIDKQQQDYSDLQNRNIALKVEIDALTKIAEEMAKDLIEQSEFLDGSFESVAKFYNFKQTKP